MIKNKISGRVVKINLHGSIWAGHFGRDIQPAGRKMPAGAVLVLGVASHYSKKYI